MLNRPYAKTLFVLTLAAYVASMAFLPGAVVNKPELIAILFRDVFPFLQFKDVSPFVNLTLLANFAAIGGCYLFGAKFYRFKEGSGWGTAVGAFYYLNFAVTAGAFFSPMFLRTFPILDPSLGGTEYSFAMGELTKISSICLWTGVCLTVLASQAFGSERDESPFK